MYRKFWALGELPEISNWGGEVLLEEKLREVVPENDFISIFERLSAPEKLSFYQQAELDLLVLRKFVNNNIFDNLQGITDATFEQGARPKSANVVSATGSTDVNEIVKFLSTQGDVKAISSPRVMTLNNQPALISVGQELFYKIKSSSTASSGGGAVAAEGELVDSVFAGILLDITPEIAENGMITLKINPSMFSLLICI